MNLFLATRQLTSARKAHLTEFLGAALEADPDFRAAWADRVLGPCAGDAGGAVPPVKRIRARPSLGGGRIRPDLLVVLEDGRRVICEHSLPGRDRARDRVRPHEREHDDSERLRRLLRLDVSGAASFRASWRPPGDDVLEHPRYIAPRRREHFLWEDLLGPLGAGSHRLSRWLATGLERLGFAPVRGQVGELCGGPAEVVERNRRNFRKLWRRTRSACRKLGWKVKAGSTCDLYLTNGSASVRPLVFLSPLYDGGRTLLVRIAPGGGSDAEELAARVRASTFSPVVAPAVAVTDGPDDDDAVVEVTVPLLDLLPENGDPEEMQDRLARFCGSIVRAVPTVEESGIPEEPVRRRAGHPVATVRPAQRSRARRATTPTGATDGRT